MTITTITRTGDCIRRSQDGGRIVTWQSRSVDDGENTFTIRRYSDGITELSHNCQIVTHLPNTPLARKLFEVRTIWADAIPA